MSGKQIVWGPRVDADGDVVTVFSDGTARQVGDGRNRQMSLSGLMQKYDLLKTSAGKVLWTASSKEEASEVLEEIQRALVTGGAESPEDQTLNVPGVKADGGKPRMSLIPWELWAEWGSCLRLVTALRVWQTGGGVADEASSLAQAVWLADHAAVSAVMAFGAEKYTDHGWRTVEDRERRYRDALWRHENACLLDPTAKDPESGLPHSAHRDACAAILYAILMEKSE